MSDQASVAGVAAMVPAEVEDDQQLDLLNEQPRTERGQVLAVLRRGPGRPAGARNKRTERTLNWLMSRHGDPRERALAFCDMAIADIAVMLNCTLIQAAVEQRLMIQTILPYVAQKQPLAIDVTSKRAIYLTIDAGGQASAGAPGGMSIAARIIEDVANQPLSDSERGAVERLAVEQSEQEDETNG